MAPVEREEKMEDKGVENGRYDQGNEDTLHQRLDKVRAYARWIVSGRTLSREIKAIEAAGRTVETALEGVRRP